MFNGPEDDPAQEAPEAATGGETPSADGTETPTEPLPEGNVE